MKLSTLALLAACAVATTPAAAQKTVSEVTETQIADYKRMAKAACQEGGKKQGDPDAKVDAFCTCLMESLDKGMSVAEWQQAVIHARNKQADKEREVLTPHLKKLDACRPQS